MATSEAAYKRVLLVLRIGTADAPRLNAELARGGYSVAQADSVPEARRLLTDGADFDAAIIGTDLPVVYGWELVSRLKSDARTARMPVIVLGEEGPDDKKHAENYGSLFIPLPANASDIVQQLDSLIHTAQRAELRPVRVLLLTDVCEIEGTVHVSPELERFSDGWEAVISDRRSFVPVTEARLSSLDGERLIATTAFLQVPKAQLRAVLPVDDRPSPERASDPDGSAALIGKLTRVAAGLARELAEERNMPVRSVLEEFVTELTSSKPRESE